MPPQNPTKTKTSNSVLDTVASSKKRKAMAQVVKAQDLHKAGALPAAAKAYSKGAQMAPQDLDVIAVAADGLAELGQRNQAIEILQAALQNNAVTETVLMVIGKIAQNLDLPEIAAKIYSTAIDLNPGEPSNYVNLVECYRQEQRFDESVELAKSAIEIFPTHAPLWNMMGTLMQNQRQGKLARTFYDEALRLEPENPTFRMNIANLQCDLNEDPIENYEEVIAAQPNNHEAHFAVATYKLQLGHLAEGWAHYEHRKLLDRGYSKSVRFAYGMPEWKGQPLAGKSILIMAEQGLGDEIFFALNFARLQAEADKIYIGCDPRLVSIFKRSFPDAEVSGYIDQRIEGMRHRSFPDFDRKVSRIDYCVWAGSLPSIWWKTPAGIPHFDDGYLKPDKALQGSLLPTFPNRDGRLKVGLSWRSGNISFERSGFYMGLEGARQFLIYADVDFYCLQYGWDQSEIEWFREKVGVSVHTFPDIDLKDDLESNLALMAEMDLVIGPPIATQQMAMALGVPTWMITGGAPWWQFGSGSWGSRFASNLLVSSGVYGLGQERACHIYALVLEAYLKRFDSIDVAMLGPAVQRALAAYDEAKDHTDVREFRIEYEPEFDT